MLTLVASALAGGDCIDDVDVLRTGGTAGAIGCVVKVLSTLGTFLRSFRWGHVRQLDRVSRQGFLTQLRVTLTPTLSWYTWPPPRPPPGARCTSPASGNCSNGPPTLAPPSPCRRP